MWYLSISDDGKYNVDQHTMAASALTEKTRFFQRKITIFPTDAKSVSEDLFVPLVDFASGF